MSTYRYREKVGATQSNRWTGYWTDMVTGAQGTFLGNLPSRSTTPITRGDGWPDREVMSDYISSGPGPRHFQNCEHTVTRWVPMWSVRRFTFPAPKHPMEQRQLCWIKCVGSSGEYSTPNWTSMFDDLASKLNGSLACGSNVLVTLGEARKTIQMMKNPFGLLRADWRKLAGQKPSAHLKGGANLFLEKKYGWDSFYYDCKNAVKTFRRIWGLTSPDSNPDFDEDRLSVVDKQVIGKGSWVGTDTSLCVGVDEANSLGPLHYTVSGVRARRSGGQRKTRLGCHQIVDLAQRWSRTRQILNAFGLTLDTLPDAIWELIPYSFVVDWFADPLGIWNLPRNIQRLRAVDVRDLGYTTKLHTEFDVEVNPHYGLYYAGPWAYTAWSTREPGGQAAHATCAWDYFSRNLLSGSSLWTLASSKLISSGLSLSQGLAGTALSVQRLLR